jgi:hypothetical protein
VNIVLEQMRNVGAKDFIQGSWYVISVYENIQAFRRDGDGAWVAVGRHLNPDGSLILEGFRDSFETKSEAVKRAKQSAKIKCARRGFENRQDNIERLPEFGHRWLVVDRKWVSATEMVKMIRAARLERYVYFDDVNGIEEWFDKGVQYLGFLTSVDDLMDVHDRFGEMRAVMVTRLARVELTEALEELPEELREGMEVK